VRLEIRPTDSMTFDLFSSSVVVSRPGLRINRSVDRQNFHGVYGAIREVLPQATVEPFAFWQTASGVSGETGPAGDMDRYSAGIRVVGSLGDGFDYGLTVVDQWGDYGSSRIDSWAYSVGAGYTFPSDLSPRVYFEYNFGGGDSDPLDGVIGGFNDVYPTAHPYYGYNDLVGWRNLKNARVGTTFEPFDRLGIRADYHRFWLANPRDGLYNVAGALTLAPVSDGATDGHVGDEIDVTFDVQINAVLSAGGGVGHMFPGPFVDASSPGAGNTFTFLSFSYKF